MRTYFTWRPLVLWTANFTPNDAFMHELSTLDWINYKLVSQKQWDNRRLSYFEVDEEFKKEVVIETLLKYSYHEKTVDSAKLFIEGSCNNIKTIDIVWDKIEFKLEDTTI